MTILVIATGGSIDKVYSASTSSYTIGEPAARWILQRANLGLAYKIESLLRKDSLELTGQDRQLIYDCVVSAAQHRLVITHGTDTMVDTARYLSEIEDKVLVLTGAMQPASSLNSDASFNLGGAIVAAATLPNGVYIVMNGQVFQPDNVCKDVSASQFMVLTHPNHVAEKGAR